jgi:hypothetical protein
MSGALRIFHDSDSGFGNINELVKRWNHRAKVNRTRDRENYINEDIKFLFEYSGFGNLRGAPLTPIHGRNSPLYVPVVLAEAAIDKSSWEVGDLFDKHLGGKPCVISGWDKKLVLIENVKLMDEREKFIPSWLTMGLQIEKGLMEGWRDPIGESRLYGFIKPCLGFAKWELQVPPFFVRGGDRGHDFPVGVIKSGAEIVNNIATNKRCPVYDGFVSFCEGGALSTLCVCFENVGERALFLEQCIQLVDVFRGPMNLEHCAICHGPPNVAHERPNRRAKPACEGPSRWAG